MAMAEDKTAGSEKKIIIDEDWKSKVQAEREQAEPPKDMPHGPLPPPDFSLLLTMLGTQALISIGAVPNPITQKTDRDLEQAKHFIDLLGVLEEKTRNNLTPDEKKHLDELLYQLRMLYVQSQAKS